MKKLLIILLMIFRLIPLSALTATLESETKFPVAGEVFNLVITVDSAENFSFNFTGKLPDDVKLGDPVLRFRENSSFSSSSGGFSFFFSSSSGDPGNTAVTGNQSRSVYSIRTIIGKPGKYTIPALKLTAGKNTVTTNQLTIEVKKAEDLPPEEQGKAELLFFPDRPVYAGETVEVILQVILPQNREIAGSPQLQLQDFTGLSFLPEGKFALRSRPQYRQERLCLEFGAVCQAKKIGKYNPECQIILPLTNRTGYSKRNLTLNAGKELQILPLPAAPADAVDTNLIGNWEISGKISKNTMQTGDMFEITLTFSGNQPAFSFRAPELSFPGTRAFPPEITGSRNKQQFTVKYPFVAIQPGQFKPEITLASFDPAKGKYLEHQLSFPYSAAVNPSIPAAGAATVSGDPEIQDPAVQLAPFTLAEDEESVAVPLIKNHLFTIILLPLAALLIAAASFLPRHGKDRKKIRLKKELNVLAEKLPDSGKAALLESGPAVIAAAMGLNEGSDFAEIAQHIQEPEIAGFFRELARANYAPAGENTAPPDPEMLKKIAKFLKKLLIFAICFLGPVLPGATVDSARNAFLQGNYRTAADEFQQLNEQRKNAPSPALWFDLGCAEYMQGNFPQAWVCFSRASLLAPENETYASAVNRAAEKAGIEKKTVSILDFFRPDEYIMIAAVLISMALTVIALRKKIPVWWSVCTIILLLSAASGMLFAAGKRAEDYASDRAVVVSGQARLCTIPAGDGGNSAALPAGTILTLREENNGFFRVENEQNSGWVKKEDLQQIFPWKLY